MTFPPGCPRVGPQHSHQQLGQLQQHRLHLRREQGARRGLHLLRGELGWAGELHRLAAGQPAAQLEGVATQELHLQAGPVSDVGLPGQGGAATRHRVGEADTARGDSNIKVSSEPDFIFICLYTSGLEKLRLHEYAQNYKILD